jgi:hypothetical protein
VDELDQRFGELPARVGDGLGVGRGFERCLGVGDGGDQFGLIRNLGLVRQPFEIARNVAELDIPARRAQRQRLRLLDQTWRCGGYRLRAGFARRALRRSPLLLALVACGMVRAGR